MFSFDYFRLCGNEMRGCTAFLPLQPTLHVFLCADCQWLFLFFHTPSQQPGERWPSLTSYYRNIQIICRDIWGDNADTSDYQMDFFTAAVTSSAVPPVISNWLTTDRRMPPLAAVGATWPPWQLVITYLLLSNVVGCQVVRWRLPSFLPSLRSRWSALSALSNVALYQYRPQDLFVCVCVCV